MSGPVAIIPCHNKISKRQSDLQALPPLLLFFVLVKRTRKKSVLYPRQYEARADRWTTKVCHWRRWNSKSPPGWFGCQGKQQLAKGCSVEILVLSRVTS